MRPPSPRLRRVNVCVCVLSSFTRTLVGISVNLPKMKPIISIWDLVNKSKKTSTPAGASGNDRLERVVAVR